MIKPVILKGKLIEEFREHLMNFNYYYIISEGNNIVDYKNRKLNKEEADLIIDRFIKSNIPIVCLAGSKSAVPFFDYHCAINLGKNEAYLNELLIKEPLEKNLLNALTMAFYVLYYKTKEIKRLVVPLRLDSYNFEEEIKSEVIGENKTILYK